MMVFSSVAARFFTPQIGGAGAVPAGTLGEAFTAFRIDHDERFNQTTHARYQSWKAGPWVGFNWRYDSGLVASSVPVADASGTVDLSGLTGDQQLALYNFLSTFSGTHFVTPRALTAEIGFHF
jgi:hypothetical protein